MVIEKKWDFESNPKRQDNLKRNAVERSQYLTRIKKYFEYLLSIGMDREVAEGISKYYLLSLRKKEYILHKMEKAGIKPPSPRMLEKSDYTIIERDGIEW